MRKSEDEGELMFENLDRMIIFHELDLQKLIEMVKKLGNFIDPRIESDAGVNYEFDNCVEAIKDLVDQFGYIRQQILLMNEKLMQEKIKNKEVKKSKKSK